jgi:hypothetical protein
MWEGLDDKGAGVVLVQELNALKECHEMEWETIWCSLGGGVNLERVGRGRKLMGLRASMGALATMAGYSVQTVLQDHPGCD